MSKKVDFLYLSESDMMKAGVLDMGRCMASMEEMFRLLQREDYRMGGQGNEHGMRVLFPKSSEVEGMPLHEPDRRFMIMPAYLGGRFRKFGIKSYGSNPRNKEEWAPKIDFDDVSSGRGHGDSNGLYVGKSAECDADSGSIRGGDPAFEPGKTRRRWPVIGPGAMARYAMMAFLEVRPQIKTVKIKGRSQKGIRSSLNSVRSISRRFSIIRYAARFRKHAKSLISFILAQPMHKSMKKIHRLKKNGSKREHWSSVYRRC